MSRENLTKAQRWAIADRLASERLESVNKQVKTATPRANTFYVKYIKRFF